MRGLFERLRRSLGRAFFDSSYYLLANKDISNAIQIGQVPSAYWHFERYGKAERRAIARNLLPRIALPRLFVVFKPGEDFLSGVKINVSPGSGRSWKFLGFRIDKTKISKAWETHFDEDSLLSNGSGYVTWSPPIEKSKGSWFFALLVRSDRTNPFSISSQFILSPGADYVYSPPEVSPSTAESPSIGPVTQGMFDRLRRSLEHAFFDSSYYLLANKDILNAIQIGQAPSAYWHFETYGKSERRATARNLLPNIALPRLFVVFKPGEDFLSGVKINVSPGSGRSWKFIGFRIAKTKISKAWETHLDEDSMLSNGTGYVTWSPPIAKSKGNWFVALLVDCNRANPIAPLGQFILSPDAEYVYSAPTAPITTPIALLMSPVTQCNLNCIHCISRHSRVRVNELSDEIWRDIASNEQIYSISSDYSGDIIFTDRKYDRWLERFISHKASLRLSTHANDLTIDVSRRLINARLIDINFSIDTMDPLDYPKIRVGARPLEEVLNNIAKFMKIRNKRPKIIRTSISLVLMKRNLGSIRAIVDFAAEHRIDLVVGAHLMVYTSDMVEESALLDLKRYREIHAEATAHASAKGVVLWMPAPVSNMRPRSGHAPCPAPWHTATIVGNGDVMACCMPGTVVGNLNRETFESVWNGARMQRFREKVNTDDPPAPCANCGLYRYENNFESYVPGLPKEERQRFVQRVLSQN